LTGASLCDWVSPTFDAVAVIEASLLLAGVVSDGVNTFDIVF
jgi:hypothetical protein